MKVNGIEFEFNGTTIEGIQKIEDALKSVSGMREKASKIADEGRLAESAELTIEANREFLLRVTGQDLIGECNNPTLANTIVEDFNQKIESQRKKVKEEYFKRNV